MVLVQKYSHGLRKYTPPEKSALWRRRYIFLNCLRRNIHLSDVRMKFAYSAVLLLVCDVRLKLVSVGGE